MATNDLLLRLTEQAVERCVDPIRYQEMRKAYDTLMAQPDVLGVGGGSKGITLSQWCHIVTSQLTHRCADELSVPHLSPERIVAWLRSLDEDFDAVLDWATVHRSLAAASVRRRFPPSYQHKLATHRWMGTSITACVWAERCGRMLAIIDDNPSVHVFNAAGEADGTWPGHGAAPLAIAHCPENDCTVSTACDRSAIVWDTKRGSPAQRVLLDEPATCVHVDAASGKILLAMTDGRVALVAASALPIAHEARGSMLGTAQSRPGAGPSGVGASGSPDLAVASPAFGGKRHRDWVTTATSCRLKGLVATGSRDRTIMVWRVDTAAFVRRLVGHARAVQCLECVQRLATLVSSEVGTGNIYIWPLTSASDTPSRRLGHEADMVSLHVDPFGESIVAIEVTMRVSVWDSGRLTLAHSTDVAESTKPPSGLKCAYMAPCSRTVMAVSGTHLVNFVPKPYDSTPTALGRQVLRLYLDAATFTVVVVTTGTVLFVNGVDAAVIREIAAPFGRRAPVESCIVAGGTVFLSSRRVTVAISIRDALAGGNLRRVVGLSQSERVAGISRGGGPKSWIFVLGSGAVHIGKLRRESTQYVFERSSQLSAPSVGQLGTPHGHVVSPSAKIRPVADPITPATGVTAAVVHCAFWRDDVEIEPSSEAAEPGDSRRDHSVGLIVYDSVPGCDTPVAALNTRTLARATSSLPGRDGFVAATYLQGRGALVVLHQSSIAVYSAWNFHRIVEISGLSGVLGAQPTSIAYAGGDSAILGGLREGLGVVDLRSALDHFFANAAPSALAGATSGAAASLPTTSPSAVDEVAAAAARGPSPSLRNGVSASVAASSGLARFVAAPHPPPAHGFSATVVHAVERASSAEVALKIHDLSSTLRAEVAIRQGLGPGVDRYVVRFEGSWGGEESDGLTVPKRKLPLPTKRDSTVEAPPEPNNSVAAVANDAEETTEASAAAVSASPAEPTLADVLGEADAAVALLCINPPRSVSQRRGDRLRMLPRGVVMERCGTTLASAVSESAWPIEQRCRVIHHLLSACSAVLAAGFVHTELRPRHVIRASEGWKLCGVDAILPLGSPVRSPLSLGRHCPPEWVRQSRAGDNPKATEAAGVWALGCLAFEVACQKPLFTGRSETAVLDSIATTTDVLLSLNIGVVPEAARGFIARALKVNPGQRPTFAELEAGLEEENPMPFPNGDRRSPVASPAASPTDPAGRSRRGGSPDPHHLAVVPLTIGAGVIATSTDAASCVTVLRHKSLLGAVVSVATCPDSSLVLIADTDTSHPSGGCVHLVSFDAGAEQQGGGKELGFHGSMPPLEVGVPTAEGRWGAPLRLLSSTARRGIGAASSTPTGGAGGPADRDGDEAGCLADALVALGPVLPRDAVHDEVLRMWEGVSQSDIDGMLQDGQTGQQLTEREVLFAFEQQVAKRSRFYDDTGAKRRPGEQLVLYAPQTKTRLTQLEMARVLASKAEHQYARSRVRLAKVLADAQQGSGQPADGEARKHKLDPDFVRRVPVCGNQRDGALGSFGGPRDDPDGTLLLQSLVPVTERELMRAPKPDPASIRRQARVAYNVEVARNPDTEAWVKRELGRLSPTRTRGAPGGRNQQPQTPPPDA